MARRRGLRVERRGDGTLVLQSMPHVMALVLGELPALLSDEAPGIRERSAGSPYPEDPDSTHQWEKYAVPELAHLFESARATVLGDLEGLVRQRSPKDRFRLAIPATHLPAWHSSLAAIRVALAETHGIEEEDMEGPQAPLAFTAKEQALAFVNLLGWVQGLLLEAEEPKRRRRKARRPRGAGPR